MIQQPQKARESLQFESNQGKLRVFIASSPGIEEVHKKDFLFEEIISERNLKIHKRMKNIRNINYLNKYKRVFSKVP